MNKVSCVIIGAGAAGLHCAGHLEIADPSADRTVMVIDHSARMAEKVRISGGGRCNFTNLEIEPKRFLSANPHFCKSALKRYTQWDFITQVAEAGIAYHEKTLGQLFCDGASHQIIDMLADQARRRGARIQLDTKIIEIQAKPEGGFRLDLEHQGRNQAVEATNIVVATGGLSIPKIGASALGYRLAEQFGHGIVPTRAGLVPLTFSGDILEHTKALSGISVESTVACGNTTFDEGMLFTHRGLSGPSILQISNYWREGQTLKLNLCPSQNIDEALRHQRDIAPRKRVKSLLSAWVPDRLAQAVCDEMGVQDTLANTSNKTLNALAQRLHNWTVRPSGTEGYRTAEVTLGGVDTKALSSKTMESQNQPGLYFVGEVVDVTGWLGGYNFQWAWSSAWAAAQAINSKMKGEASI